MLGEKRFHGGCEIRTHDQQLKSFRRRNTLRHWLVELRTGKKINQSAHGGKQVLPPVLYVPGIGCTAVPHSIPSRPNQPIKSFQAQHQSTGHSLAFGFGLGFGFGSGGTY